MSARPKGRFRLCATLALVIFASPSLAVDTGTIDQFVRLSDRFHAQLPNSAIAGLDQGQRRSRAVCILSRFEGAYGSGGVQQLMGLMTVLSRGTEFDDPTVVAFNQSYGVSYEQTVRDCTNAARSS